ncbi:hypothetical protein [Actinoplanes sp. L3-i22]|uniref:hypothetical protein n=1 Tax=Actinoplanes sp. L3-i22 TaxID=2836373 RepID=UPI001C747B3F|nr:hypothetical protein [Actinoplanes sp. L3-i22]BCY05111.1 hypothetical protein L3i22_001990 [Actinoplanes sp. L3-i22]
MEDLSHPEPPALPEPPKRSRTPGFLVALIAILAVVAAGVVVFWPTGDEAAKATATPAPPRPATPFELAEQRLRTQGEALAKGDEKAWLAPVDPTKKTLLARYRTIFRNLRALEISHAEFHGDKLPDTTATQIVMQAALGYCFSGVVCPEWHGNYGEGSAKATYRLTFQLIKGVWTITALDDKTGVKDNYLQPAPWDNRALTFVKGKRVIVAGPSSQAKRLKQVLTLAEKAAKVVDRYAGYVGNPQQRYRIYVADEKGWKSWYGGVDQSWIIGYEMPLNATGGDIILRARASDNQRQLAVTVQHELTHVVTLAGGDGAAENDQWLIEGIAEYVGALPRKPQETGNRDVLAESFRRRGVPKTIAVPSLADDADDLTVNTLYAMGHYATACMAAKYGERKLLTFTNLVLREGQKPDQASRTAYGKPFATVDKACLSWIRQRV